MEAREPPSMAEAETYWKSLWGEEAQHNETAEWRMDKKGTEKENCHLDWRPIQITEINMSKSHNWNFPGNDQKQNYWPKAFPATHRHIAKNFNAIKRKWRRHLIG